MQPPNSRNTSKYWIEILVSLCATVVGIIELAFKLGVGGAVTLIALGLMLSATSIAIRRDVDETLAENLHIYKLLLEIKDKEMQARGHSIVHKLIKELRDLQDGKCVLSPSESISHEIAILNDTKQSVDAIHVCLPTTRMYIWTKSGPFENLRSAFENLDSAVVKQRIFVVGDELFASDGTIVDRVAEEICNKQVSPRSQGGLGFELRLLKLSTVNKLRVSTPVDTLIADHKTVVTLQFSGGDYSEVIATSNKDDVAQFTKQFNDLWFNAEPYPPRMRKL